MFTLEFLTPKGEIIFRLPPEKNKPAQIVIFETKEQCDQFIATRSKELEKFALGYKFVEWKGFQPVESQKKAEEVQDQESQSTPVANDQA